MFRFTSIIYLAVFSLFFNFLITDCYSQRIFLKNVTPPRNKNLLLLRQRRWHSLSEQRRSLVVSPLAQPPSSSPQTTKKTPESTKKVKKIYREVLPFQKIILSLCYEDCEPTNKSRFLALDFIDFLGPHRRSKLSWRTNRLQGLPFGMPSLNY